MIFFFGDLRNGNVGSAIRAFSSFGCGGFLGFAYFGGGVGVRVNVGHVESDFIYLWYWYEYGYGYDRNEKNQNKITKAKFENLYCRLKPNDRDKRNT